MGEAAVNESSDRASDEDLVKAYKNGVPLSEHELFRLSQLGVLDEPPQSKDSSNQENIAA